MVSPAPRRRRRHRARDDEGAVQPVFIYDHVTRISRQVAPARTEGPTHRIVVRPFGELGFKAYMTRRAFFTDDTRMMFAAASTKCCSASASAWISSHGSRISATDDTDHTDLEEDAVLRQIAASCCAPRWSRRVRVGTIADTAASRSDSQAPLDRDVLADYAQRIPAGSKVRVERTDGASLRGTLLKTGADSSPCSATRAFRNRRSRCRSARSRA